MKRELATLRNNWSRKVSHTSRSGSKRNYVKIDLGAGYTHNLAVFDEAFDRILQGHEIITRVKLENTPESLIADILDLDTGEIVEIQISETDKSIERKKVYWEGNGFEVVVRKIKHNGWKPCRISAILAKEHSSLKSLER